ncbi:MAG: DUF4258 domain-containing protein [Planctomycetota bacterium]
MKINLSEHAILEMEQRRIDKKIVIEMIESPQQIIPSLKDRIIVQGKYQDADLHKEMLLRIIGRKKRNNYFFVITVYKTSKIDKYWRT